jgi:hypothetical protein
MSYTKFDRHENMNEDVRHEIMNLIKDIRYDETLDDNDNMFHLENMLYGMFDGYLYENVQMYALELPSNLEERVMTVYNTCKTYPKLKQA